MGDHDHRHPHLALQLFNEVKNLSLNRDIQCGGWLIRDQQIRLADERHGDDHPLAHAARQLVRILGHTDVWRRNTHPIKHGNRLLDTRLVGEIGVELETLRQLTPDGLNGI